MKINMNDDVRVVLTPFGQDLLDQYYKKDINQRPTQKERDGEFQLWHLMEIFGPSIFFPMQQVPFKENSLEYIPEEIAKQRGDALTIRQLQENLPWTIHYARDFRDSPLRHKDFQHAGIHVMKALGKIAAMINDAEHAGTDWDECSKYLADLVICAMRMANTIPGDKIDLQRAVISRIETKNEVKL